MAGLTEKMVRETLSRVLVRAGIPPYFNIVLFGSDAANPHGGVDENRELKECEFVLIDAGVTFQGYSSDITRTFLPSGTNVEKCRMLSGNHTLEELWTIVYEAQSAAIDALIPGNYCADVDLAARGVIEDKGLGKHFVHRVGHGLGIDGHERYSSLSMV
jgi:Xaa-Pro aminopeptidase